MAVEYGCFRPWPRRKDVQVDLVKSESHTRRNGIEELAPAFARKPDNELGSDKNLLISVSEFSERSHDCRDIVLPVHSLQNALAAGLKWHVDGEYFLR